MSVSFGASWLASDLCAIMTIKDRFASRVWVLAYSLEEARQRYADRRQLLRQAAACLLLALLRLAGVRCA